MIFPHFFFLIESLDVILTKQLEACCINTCVDQRKASRGIGKLTLVAEQQLYAL